MFVFSDCHMKLIMDLDSIEGLNEVRPSVYRVSMKLQCLQRLCHMDGVCVQHITASLRSVGGAKPLQGVRLNRQEVMQCLNRMFHSVSQEVQGHVTVEASEDTCDLMFRLYNRCESLSADSLQTALIALTAEPLLTKYRALVSVAVNSSGSVSRSGLRFLLRDLSQVPAAVQEEGVFGDVEAAVKSCFNGVLTPTVCEEHVLSWLQSEPHLLVWLPTLYRLSVSQNVCHNVRCHTCKTFPITGLRYRCLKCVNVQVCQSCFLTDRQTRKHKTHHPVLEFCTQPTWRESLSSLVHSARHALLPRRYTQREADRRRVVMWAEPGETQDSAPPPSDSSTRLAAAGVSHSPSSDRDVSHNALVQPPLCSKALQTDEDTPPQQVKASALMSEVRNLQRDKWLLEQQVTAWRLTVQSEQGILEDRCSEMEVTMKTLKEHNLCLQNMLTQALNKMEDMAQSVDMGNTENTENMENMENTENTGNMENMRDTWRENVTLTSDTEENTDEEEDDVLLKDEWSEEELPTPSPTMHQDTPPSHDIYCEDEEEIEVDGFLCCPIGQRDGLEEAGRQEEETCLSEEENCGMCSPEEVLQETVERLKTVMEADRWRERHTGERKRAELLEAADQVGDSIHHLVDAVRTNSDDQIKGFSCRARLLFSFRSDFFYGCISGRAGICHRQSDAAADR
ncbi:dystrotelin [Larimichthys crocea]|uniref:dystrotelin n=1 Tax=Larimichthys crocea TaxID=215358 RepID=UPI000F5DA2BA|nr:dystrotelin-like [Larimichthys crocea]